MPVVNDAHIKEAESLLIGGNTFDLEEQIPFIKELDICDLLAVPGSGKTTALLAKLYCLSKHLPFNDGSGVLILSHTNAAVEEIEKNLKPYSPILFEYPNFVGTVQSFINKFLANPACQVKYGSYIRQNDNDLYLREVKDFYYSLEWKKQGEIEPKLKNKLYGKANYGRNGLNTSEKNNNAINLLYYLEIDLIDRKLLTGSKKTTLFKYGGNTEPFYLEVEEWKESLFKKGLLSYKDSFSLAEWYIENYPEIKKLLQNRFKYVFVDETQDLEAFQIEIIEKIFNDSNSNTVIQRVGDINQSIYNSGKRVKIEADWNPRNPMFLSGSMRLTKEVSELVNCFTLNRNENEDGEPQFIVNGQRELQSPIKPHLILFNEKSKDTLEDKFRDLIYQHQLDQTIEAKKYGFKIIGWNARWENTEKSNGKLRLEDIFSSYKKEVSSNKETYNTLSKHLQLFDKNKLTLESSRKTILNALITILRLENKTYKAKLRGKEVERYYTKSELIKYIKNLPDLKKYEDFKTFLYQWSFDLITTEKPEKIYVSIKNFAQNEFKEWFGLSINADVNSFLEDSFNKIVQLPEILYNHSVENEVKINIGTVHSVKGQTHCATMYVETSYHDYESCKLQVVAKKATKTKPEEYLPNPLLFKNHQYRKNKDKRAKETLKMMYVGFSRPTHLLCYAMLKDNLIDEIKNYVNCGWEVIDITEYTNNS